MNNTYTLSVATYQRFLKNLDAVIDKAAAHCDAKKIDPSALLTARLYPDMFHFTKQVQVTCDFAKGGSARLAGVEVPKFEDSENSFADLKARIKMTQDFIGSLKVEQFEGADSRMITVPLKEPVTLPGVNYLQTMALPNFYFHLTTAYAILRHNGVELGKTDFIGPR
jgi:uncharacterized protein